jgi:hypothetical protein
VPFSYLRPTGFELGAGGVPLELLHKRTFRIADGLRVERDRLMREQRVKYLGTNKVINGTSGRHFR